MKKYYLPIINKQVETVVLANGKYPTHKTPLSLLNNCNYLVSCDGATNQLVESGLIPHIIVGDCDSLSLENKERFANIIHQISEQETNDLTKAVNHCVTQGRTDITILGATGKREDHTIGNISLLCEYMLLANVKIVTDYGIFVAINSKSSFESYQGQQISLFCLDPLPISASGLLYKIEQKSFNRWWQATLNEAISTEFTIDTQGFVIVYRAF